MAGQFLPPGGRCPAGADEEWRHFPMWNAGKKEHTAFQVVPFLQTEYEIGLYRRSSSVSLRSTAINYGMIAPGNHLDFDSLRGAPPPGEAMALPRSTPNRIYLFAA